ncbi:transposase, partial [Lactiplantibacillus plantarum]|nr:transposase [Lactiplantibacillus plantarum]
MATARQRCWCALRTGCQWRELPVDFPRWQLVYYYYRV